MNIQEQPYIYTCLIESLTF